MPEQPWQKLECILTVWIEMIQRRKIVALPDNVGKTTHEFLATGGVHEIRGPERDLVTGARRFEHGAEPWTIQPWAPKDLEESLKVWSMAVESIEQKMGLSGTGSSDGRLDAATLDAARIPESFARLFLFRARKPRFEFIAPGLRVPTSGVFATQPFINPDHRSEEEDLLPPILLLRSERSVNTRGLRWFGFPPRKPPFECPSGLYLTPCQRSYRYPQEDGCAIILPFAVTPANGPQVEFLDPREALLQPAVNPYNDKHPIQLQALLEIVYMNVQRGNWEVDANGVVGGIEKWREAGMEEKAGNYVVNLGPGGYW
jgi:hypothetical protein